MALLVFGSAVAFATRSYSFFVLETPTTAMRSVGLGMNDSGQVVGSGNYLATLWNGNTSISLGTLGGNYGLAWDINNHGKVVGTSQPQNSVLFRATLWDSEAIHDLGFSVEATAINSSGQIVGHGIIGISNGGRAYLVEHGTINELPGIGGDVEAGAYGINDSGLIVGSSAISSNNSNRHATLWQDGVPVDLGTLGGSSSYAYAINNLGVVVGDTYTSTDAQGERPAFVWNQTEMIDLGTLGGSSSAAFDINDAGKIVGESLMPDGRSRATLWDGFVPVDLDHFRDRTVLGGSWRLTHASAINNEGWITGYATVGGTVGFLLVPRVIEVPEPESFLLGLVGLAFHSMHWSVLVGPTRRQSGAPDSPKLV
jgi:probable HAF family extracellular repeat protein